MEKHVPVIVKKAEGHDSIIMKAPGNSKSGAILLRTEELAINEQGFLRDRVKVGLFKGEVTRLEELVKKTNLKEGDDFSKKVFPVKLVIKEQTEPFYSEQEPKINPTTGEVVTCNGETVYRQTFVRNIDDDTKDVLLPVDRMEVPDTADQEKVESGSSYDSPDSEEK